MKIKDSCGAVAYDPSYVNVYVVIAVLIELEALVFTPPAPLSKGDSEGIRLGFN